MTNPSFMWLKPKPLKSYWASLFLLHSMFCAKSEHLSPLPCYTWIRLLKALPVLVLAPSQSNSLSDPLKTQVIPALNGAYFIQSKIQLLYYSPKVSVRSAPPPYPDHYLSSPISSPLPESLCSRLSDLLCWPWRVPDMFPWPYDTHFSQKSTLLTPCLLW